MLAQISCIGMVTSPTLDVFDPRRVRGVFLYKQRIQVSKCAVKLLRRYAWKDDGLVLASSAGDQYNAIDPCVWEDATGVAWLSFGSFWGGIFATPFQAPVFSGSVTDEGRGRGAPVLQSPPKSPFCLANRPAPDAMEASHLFSHGAYVYLLTSWGYCCRGVSSTYEVRMSPAPTFTLTLYHTTCSLAGPAGPLFSSPWWSHWCLHRREWNSFAARWWHAHIRQRFRLGCRRRTERAA
jgi:hypothetical protein